jgi:hypothetical protein
VVGFLPVLNINNADYIHDEIVRLVVVVVVVVVVFFFLPSIVVVTIPIVPSSLRQQTHRPAPYNQLFGPRIPTTEDGIIIVTTTTTIVLSSLARRCRRGGPNNRQRKTQVRRNGTNTYHGRQ